MVFQRKLQEIVVENMEKGFVGEKVGIGEFAKGYKVDSIRLKPLQTL